MFELTLLTDKRQVFIPAGCAHGFYTYTDSTLYYLQAGEFTPALEQVSTRLFKR